MKAMKAMKAMSDDDTPRAYTAEEMRIMFLGHLLDNGRYWASADLSRREFASVQDEISYRLEGLLFSFLVALDGRSGGLPPFDLVPRPHASDRAYHQEHGENWWSAIVINSDIELHEEGNNK